MQTNTIYTTLARAVWTVASFWVFQHFYSSIVYKQLTATLWNRPTTDYLFTFLTHCKSLSIRVQLFLQGYNPLPLFSNSTFFCKWSKDIYRCEMTGYEWHNILHVNIQCKNYKTVSKYKQQYHLKQVLHFYIAVHQKSQVYQQAAPTFLYLCEHTTCIIQDLGLWHCVKVSSLKCKSHLKPSENRKQYFFFSLCLSPRSISNLKVTVPLTNTSEMLIGCRCVCMSVASEH